MGSGKTSGAVELNELPPKDETFEEYHARMDRARKTEEYFRAGFFRRIANKPKKGEEELLY